MLAEPAVTATRSRACPITFIVTTWSEHPIQRKCNITVRTSVGGTVVVVRERVAREDGRCSVGMGEREDVCEDVSVVGRVVVERGSILAIIIQLAVK